MEIGLFYDPQKNNDLTIQEEVEEYFKDLNDQENSNRYLLLIDAIKKHIRGVPLLARMLHGTLYFYLDNNACSLSDGLCVYVSAPVVDEHYLISFESKKVDPILPLNSRITFYADNEIQACLAVVRAFNIIILDSNADCSEFVFDNCNSDMSSSITTETFECPFCQILIDKANKNLWLDGACALCGQKIMFTSAK